MASVFSILLSVTGAGVPEENPFHMLIEELRE